MKIDLFCIPQLKSVNRAADLLLERIARDWKINEWHNAYLLVHSRIRPQ